MLNILSVQGIHSDSNFVNAAAFWGHLRRTECCCVVLTELCCAFVFPTQALVFPNQLYEVVFEEELSTTSISIRLYGGALLSKSPIHASSCIAAVL